jgi:hypothetical protein
MHDRSGSTLAIRNTRVIPGGFIVFDDYESTTTRPGAVKAINQFPGDKLEAVQRFADLGNTARSFIVKLSWRSDAPVA